jgi:serine/threonine protein kinase
MLEKIERIDKQIGDGAYGKVYKAKLTNIKETLAIKRLFVIKKSNFTFSLKELDICLKLYKHPNICGTKYIVNAENQWKDQDVDNGCRNDCIAFAFSLAECDLSALCEKEVINESRGRKIIMQVLLALNYMHKSGYVHGDIKPSNILYYSDDYVKIGDFGFAKKYYTNDNHSYIASDYFRAPELFMTPAIYDYTMDIWAVGCTLHYMFSLDLLCPEWNGKGPYIPIYQIQDIVYALPYDVSDVTFKNDPLGKNIKYQRKIEPEDFISKYRIKLKNNDLYLEFIMSMLMFDLRHRPSADNLLSHNYLSSLDTYIKKIKTTFPSLNESIETPIIKLVLGKRKTIESYVMKTYNQCRNLDWYRDKVLFTSIDIFDRFLVSVAKYIDDLTPKDINTYFKACLYISAKYYSSHHIYDLSYSNFPFPELSPRTIEKSKMFEDYVLKSLDNVIYNVSIYDIAMDNNKPNAKDTLSLLKFVIDGKHKNLTASDAYQRWKKQKN